MIVILDRVFAEAIIYYIVFWIFDKKKERFLLYIILEEPNLAPPILPFYFIIIYFRKTKNYLSNNSTAYGKELKKYPLYPIILPQVRKYSVKNLYIFPLDNIFSFYSGFLLVAPI